MSLVQETPFRITLISDDKNSGSGQGGDGQERDPLRGFDSQQRGWLEYQRALVDRGHYDDDGARSHHRADDDRQERR